MIITEIFARQIYNSRGLPTIKCTVILDDKIEISASVPSGASTSAFACVEMQDHDEHFFGKGVHTAVETINTVIHAALKGKSPDVVACDQQLLELDGTKNKSLLGANTMIAVSMAVCRAQAFSYNIELCELIGHLNNNKQMSIPMPLVNMINGGKHSDSQLAIQEFLLIPSQAANFAQGFEWAVNIFYALQGLLQEKGIFYAIGDEGGCAINIHDEQQAFDLLVEAIEKTVGLSNVQLGVDCAASQWYDPTTKLYTIHGQQLVAEELIAWYQSLCEKYPLVLFEDPLAEYDTVGWKAMYRQMENIYLIGDDIFATSPERIWNGAEEHIVHGSIIKPNQIGTITETLQAVQVCQEKELLYIPSHRSGETDDTFITDLAVGIGAQLIKIGGPSRGERIVKYNRLLELEETI